MSTIPNWASNSATFTGTKEELDALTATPFDSDRWLPVPAELSSVVTGSCLIDGEAVYAWRTDENGKNVAIDPMETAALIAAYGHADWYTWSNANIGCKWPPSSVGEWFRFSNTEARVTFDTPWSPPRPLFATISEALPTVTIDLRYCEGGSDFFGHDRFVAGELEEVSGGAMSDYMDSHEKSADCENWDSENMWCDCSPEERAHEPLLEFFSEYAHHTGG